jgi:xanthine dehydrogenase large subunit
VDLIQNEENRVNVRGTKAVGEPPLLLALSVWTAMADAVRNSPEAESRLPPLEIPATQEECLRAMQPGRFKKWEQK